MFDSLSEKLQATLSDVRSRGKLTEDDIAKAMRAIRLALLEADVNLAVVKQFTSAVKERALGQDVLTSLNPGQQVVKIVNDELTELMGGAGRELVFASRPPTVVLMAGLQGSGKTTACAKLALHLREEHKKDVAIAACDVYRPAAVEQLVKVGTQAGATVYEQGTDKDPVDIAAWALEQSAGKDVLIVDTAGRLHVDEELMDELVRIRKRVKPHNVLLVVDAMTGQEAVDVAQRFAEKVNFDGVVMSKLDGDARGGAALQRADRLGQADHVRLDRREDRRLPALPPGPDGAADPRHGRRADARREGAEGVRRGPGRRARAQDPQGQPDVRRLPQADEAAAADGPARRGSSR